MQLQGVYTLDGKKFEFHRQGKDPGQAIADGGFALEELGTQDSRSLLSQTWCRSGNSSEGDRDKHYAEIRPRYRTQRQEIRLIFREILRGAETLYWTSFGPRPWCGNQVGGQGRTRKSLMGTNVVLCRPFRDSIRWLYVSTRHFRAGLLIVPSLRDWVCCFDKLVAHSADKTRPNPAGTAENGLRRNPGKFSDVAAGLNHVSWCTQD